MNIEQIFEILRSGRFDQFLGTVETDFFECKGEVYVINTEASKRELAKDVSGLANSDGGVIILGLQTERNDITLGDEVVRVRPFAQSLVNLEQYRNILRSWTFPQLVNVDMQWYPSEANSAVGIVSIYVPTPDETETPYLIIRTVEDQSRVTDTIIGYAERRRDSVHHKTVHDLHSLLRRGLQYDTLSYRFDRLEDLLHGALRTMPQESVHTTPSLDDETISSRLNNSIQDAGLAARPSYSLFCYPLEQFEVPDIFASRQSRYVELLRHPPQHRSLGFNLDPGEEPYLVRGNLWRAGRGGGRRTLELWKDGTTFFIAGGDEDFLCWGHPVGGHTNNPINPYVLIESTYLFFELIRNIYALVNENPVSLMVGISLRNFKSDVFHGYMLPYRPGIAGWEFRIERKLAPEIEVFISKNISSTVPSDRAGFIVVSALYEWFGFSHDVIPFVSRRDGEEIIDITALR